jgi:DNA-binding transcriptional ArsR family regulator
MMRLRIDGVRAEFGCSPAHEALRSLHVLSAVGRHPLHISWALRARERMGPALKTEADFWNADRPLVFRDIWPDLSSWEDDLALLREAPIEDFAEQLIHGALVDRGVGPRVPLEVFLRRPDLQERTSSPVMRELIADPERCRAHFADFLEAYWNACIEREWPDMEAQLRNDIGRRGRALSRRGPAEMLKELSPHVRGAADEVDIRPPGPPREPIDLTLTERDRLLLVPSHFVWPELTAVAQRDPGRTTVLVVYAVAEMQQQGRVPVPPADLLKLLRSAGDPTRLQVLQLLAERPRSTRELAGLIGLTEAAISKQLKLLQDAGWVGSERQSYYVYYHLLRESLDELARGLEQLLG